MERLVWLPLSLFAMVIAVVALRIFFSFRTLRAVRRELAADTADAHFSANPYNGTPANSAAVPMNSNEPREKSVRKEMWVDSQYCWVVVCKNHWFHRRPNLFNIHRIVLGETDAVMPRPKINRTFLVQCDECRKKYPYKPSEVLKYEQELPESFTPHSLFREEI